MAWTLQDGNGGENPPPREKGWELPPSFLHHPLPWGPQPPHLCQDGGGKPTTPRSSTAPAAFSSIPKSGQSLFFTAHPPPQLDAGLIAYLFISAFSQLRAHTGAGWGEAEAGSPGGPKKTRGVQLPPFPQGQEEAGKRGAGSRKGGTPTASPTPFALCARLGKLKIAASIEWLQAPQRAC